MNSTYHNFIQINILLYLPNWLLLMSLFTLKAKTTLNYYKLAEGENNKGTEFSDFIFHESYIIIMDYSKILFLEQH